MSDFPKIKCDTIGYRKGYIAVTPGIHAGCINIESWDVHADVDLAEMDIFNGDFSDDAFRGNTEIEMNIEEARELVKQMQAAIAILESGKA